MKIRSNGSSKDVARVFNLGSCVGTGLLVGDEKAALISMSSVDVGE
jgi:hypothetical protein